MAEQTSAPDPGGDSAPPDEHASAPPDERAPALRDGHAPSHSTEPVPGSAGLRASHDDRDRTVEVLRVAAGDGRITAEELDERVGAALTARTYGELAALISDLPAAPGSLPLTPGSAPGAKPKDLVRIECNTGTAS